MSTIFVGLHVGAVSWMKSRRLPVDRWVEALDAEDVEPGDVVGTLPVHIASEAAALSRSV